MQSKVHPTYKTKYRVANWPAYNRALVRRGDVTVWVSSEAIAAWTASRSGRRGGQRRYSDLAIETALTLRLIYHLPLRQAEGFLHALFGIMRLDLSVPDYTTLSRRSQHLRRRLRSPVPPDEGLHLVLDSTGLSLVGAGEWAAAKHGGRGRRGWRKLHLGVDQSGAILVHTLTEATGDDATTALDLLTAVEGPLVRITADAAYDTVAVYETATARGATVVIPNGNRKPHICGNRKLHTSGEDVSGGADILPVMPVGRVGLDAGSGATGVLANTRREAAEPAVTWRLPHAVRPTLSSASADAPASGSCCPGC